VFSGENRLPVVLPVVFGAPLRPALHLSTLPTTLLNF